MKEYNNTLKKWIDWTKTWETPQMCSFYEAVLTSVCIYAGCRRPARLLYRRVLPMQTNPWSSSTSEGNSAIYAGWENVLSQACQRQEPPSTDSSSTNFRETPCRLTIESRRTRRNLNN